MALTSTTGQTPRFLLSAALALLCCLGSPAAFAHVGQGDIAGGFASGFVHPINGWDHVLAMVAVGIWGAQLGRPAIWALPVTFPMVMAFGGVLGAFGIAIPGIEVGIAFSALALGTAIAFAARPPLAVAAVIVAIFAVFHGHAHGTELPESANAMAYSLGFVMATGLLHACGILIGEVNRRQYGTYVLRVMGAMIGAGGVYFLFAALKG
jgi:urease accessory protein